MYAVIEDNKVIAYNNSRKICKIYAEKMNTEYDKVVTLVKVKKQVDLNEDLYLIKSNGNYIQQGYELYMQIVMAYSDNLDNLESTIMTLYSILERKKLSKKDRKSIMRTIVVLEKRKWDIEDYTPTLEMLKEWKSNYDEYLYSMGRW